MRDEKAMDKKQVKPIKVKFYTIERCCFCGAATNYYDWSLSCYICVRCKAIYDSIKEKMDYVGSWG